jgi:hypothetical protein
MGVLKLACLFVASALVDNLFGTQTAVAHITSVPGMIISFVMIAINFFATDFFRS